MDDNGALTWREVVDKHTSALVDELSVRLDSDLREARSQAGAQVQQARRSQAETLNQVLRRLRAAGEEHVLDLLAEGCAPYAERLVVLVFESNQARCTASIGMKKEALSFDTSSAPAVVAAIDSRDPVVALATEAEISPVLAEALTGASDAKSSRAYLFPVVARHSVVAMLTASGVEVSAPIELLCEAAGMRLETSRQALSQPHTVEVPASETAKAISWLDLSPGDQKLHLQAQRMARLRVAEMRLYHEHELRKGVAGGDLYSALRGSVDSAREQFLQEFLSKSTTMVDYLHLEILRSLASDDDRLLGSDYPGPMV